MRHRFFERPTVKHLAVVAMAFLLGLAVANGWSTRVAMDGQARWLHDQCGQQVRRTVREHIEEDRATFGFSPEDLKAPVPAVKK